MGLRKTDRYEIVEVLGSGGMGQVLVAEDTDLNRRVAVKRLHPELAARPVLVSRFLREAQLSAILDHPGVIPIHAIEADEKGAPQIAMKLVEGAELEEYIERCREASPQGNDGLDERLELFVQICQPVAYAHEKGIIHRDLKPENILLGKFGEVYVVDWGIARMLGGTELPFTFPSESHKTQAGDAIGTPSFMSPEQALGENDALTGQSDVYALGLLLFELISLRRANEGKTALGTAIQAIEGYKEPLRMPDGTEVPAELVAIVERATVLERSSRYETVGALADDVRNYLRGEPTSALPDNTRRAITRWVARNSSRAAVAGLSIILSLVILIAGGTVGGLLLMLDERAEAERREEVIATFIHAVEERAHAFDAAAASHEMLVEGLARSTVRLLESRSSEPIPLYWHADLARRAPPDFAYHARYDQRVSFEEPTYNIPDSVDRSDVLDVANSLSPLRYDLKHAMLLAADPDSELWSPTAQSNFLRSRPQPVAWSYIALSSGLGVTFPGIEEYAEDFDVRERPWYKAGIVSLRPTWGQIYSDTAGGGLMLPCTHVLKDRQGKTIGMVGLDLALDHTIQSLRPEVTGIVGAWLVDESGQVIVDASWEGKPGLVADASQPLEKPPLPDAAIRASIERKSAFGSIPRDDELVVFTQLPTLDWYLVVSRKKAALFGE